MLTAGQAGQRVRGRLPRGLRKTERHHDSRSLAPQQGAFAMPWAGPVTITEPSTTPGGFTRAGTVRIPVSATLAANEAMAVRRRRGEPVLPLAFGESGLPVHPRLIGELAGMAGAGAYGPVAGSARLRTAAAGYWSRRGLPTSPDSVVAGPGSKALLFALLLAIGSDVAVARPSWVSYAAQARLTGLQPQFVRAAAGHGGICDP